MRQSVLAALIVGIAFAITTSVGEGHHTGVACGPASDPGRAVCLPYADGSGAVRQIQASRSLTYCFDQRAANYPNFIAQVREVSANHEAALSIDWIEVSGIFETASAAGAAGCQVWHSMPATHGCGNCGAWVHYLNWPVIIEYRWQTGYSSWHTTISHELTHVYGLHEHYDDARFLSHRNTYGRWAHGFTASPGTATDAPTVMDFGTSQWRMTAYDVRHACQNIDPLGRYLLACGFAPPPPPPACVPTPTEGCWDGSMWEYPGGWKIRLNAGCGDWFERGTFAFGACDDSWSGRHVPLLRGPNGEDVWMPRGSAFYIHGRGHYVVP